MIMPHLYAQRLIEVNEYQSNEDKQKTCINEVLYFLTSLEVTSLLVWKCHNGRLNHKINQIQEKALLIVY